jgi:hypothetical protein
VILPINEDKMNEMVLANRAGNSRRLKALVLTVFPPRLRNMLSSVINREDTRSLRFAGDDGADDGLDLLRRLLRGHGPMRAEGGKAADSVIGGRHKDLVSLFNRGGVPWSIVGDS